MTPELRNFFQSYLDWVNTGAPEGEPYTREYGLCSNAAEIYKDDIRHDLSKLLKDDFGDNDWFPFNEGKMMWYHNDCGSHHLNPERINWVKEKLAAP